MRRYTLYRINYSRLKFNILCFPLSKFELFQKSENELAGLTKDQESALRKLIPLYTKIIKRQRNIYHNII